MLTSNQVAGISSFAAWLPVTVLGLLMTFSILVPVGLPILVIGSISLVASVRAARGSRRALVAIVVFALPILGWLLAPLFLVADSTPEGRLGWTVWAAELALVTLTIGAGLAALAHQRRRARPHACLATTQR